MLWNFPLHAAQSRAGGDSHQTGAIPVVERSVLHGPQPDACVAEDGIGPCSFGRKVPDAKNTYRRFVEDLLKSAYESPLKATVASTV